MEKEKRQRVSVPQMVVSGEEFPVRVRVKAEAGEGAGAVGRMVDSSQADDRKLIRLVRERRLLYARNNMPVASYYTQVKNLWDDVAATMGWSVADVRRKWSHIRNSYSRHLRNEMHGACTSKGRMVSRWYLADELEFLREHMATDIPQDKINSQRKIHECSEEMIENNLFQAQDQHLSNSAQTLVATYDRDTDIPTHGRSNPYTSYAPTLLEMDMNESSSSEPVDVKPFIHSPWFALNASQSPVLDHKPPSLQNDDSSSSTAFMPDENSSFFQFFRGIHSEYLELNARKQRRFKRKCLDFLHELLDEDDSNHQMQSYSHQENVLNLSNSHVSEEEKDVKPVVDVDGYILPTNG